jgi:hypothetical protein
MTRLRWLLGGVLAVVALGSALSALRVYIGHQLWLGGLAVGVLVAIDIGGFVSLGLARWRLAVEIAQLGQEPPQGSLFAERRQKLQAILAAGARPDLDALGAATAATELGRAYLGKYLVAVTVLVGLVGTFAGLMETLRGVAPLLADERITTLKALAGPLAGLDVTFGASLVGILVTLALALVQGDLALAEEEALTRLEERTRHVLLPAFWPPTEGAAERTARELSLLRAELAAFVVRSTQATAERVAEIAQREVDRLVAGVGAGVGAAVAATSGRVEAGLLGLAARIEAELGPLVARQEQQLAALLAGAERAAGQAAAAGADSARTIAAASAQALGASTAAVGRLEAALGSLGAQQAAASQQLLVAQGEQLTATTQALAAAFERSVGAEGQRLAAAAAGLGTAAAELGQAAQALGGPLAALPPELSALASEVALLAARSDAHDPAAGLDELARVGEGVERLEALLRLAQGPGSARG